MGSGESQGLPFAACLPLLRGVKRQTAVFGGAVALMTRGEASSQLEGLVEPDSHQRYGCQTRLVVEKSPKPPKVRLRYRK